MSDRYLVSNQQRRNFSAKEEGSKLRGPLKIGHGGSYRGDSTNIGPNQTGYDHMYATDKEDGQPQQQQESALSCATSGSHTINSDTVTTVFLQDHQVDNDFLLLNLEVIQQQNEEILKKDNIIFQLQQENALLKQRLKNLEIQKSSTDLNPIISHTVVLPAELEQDQQAVSGDYSPESLPPTEDVVATDVGDDMTLAEPVAPLTASIISSNNTLTALITISAVTQQEPVVGSVACVGQSLGLLQPSGVSISEENSTIVIIEDDSTDAVVQVRETLQIRTDLVENCDLLVAGRVELSESVGGDIVAGPQPPETTPAPLTPDQIVDTPATTDYALSPPNFSSTPIAGTTVPAVAASTTTARYSVVRSTVASDSGGESNTKNLRMSIRRKRLCSGSSQSNSTDAVTVDGTGVGTKGRDSLGVGLLKEGSRSKRKRLNGQILTFPKEYVTRVGEANLDVLRHQALAEEVIKAANLEVPHWRVKVYADSYHLEGTENLDDEVFLKRHAKLENNERRRKRWDVQRIREQRLVDKLKQRQTKTYQLNSDHSQSKITPNGGVDGRPDSLDGYETPASLWPTPEQDLHYIEVTDQLPVAAFGAPLPAIVPIEFSLPWLGDGKTHSVSGEVDTPPVTATGVTTPQNNNGRRSVGGRKSQGRESGGLSKGRSRR